jgi:hypothetical protein
VADKKRKAMSEQDLKSAVQAALADAVSYSDSVLTPERAEATDYYQGEPLGNEEEGRSQFVITEVRDAVRGTIPGVMKLFFGPERQVEFAPRKAEQVSVAKLITEHIHNEFVEKNGGFLKTLAVLKDGFVRRIGVFKYGWKDDERVAHNLKDVTSEELTVLASDDRVDLLTVTETGERPGDEAQQIPPTKLHAVTLTIRSEGRLWVEALPPEEFLYNKSARSFESADLVAHRRDDVSLSELVAMGYSEKEIKANGGSTAGLDTNEERLARQPDNATTGGDPEASEANAKYAYTEAYMLIDADGDGYAELRKLCVLGDGHILKHYPVPRRPFAVFIPDPEPHTLSGQSLADLTMDVQKMKTSIFRAQADGLSASIFPRIAFVEGQVNINDVLNTEVGAPIRTRAPGMVQTVDLPFKGGDADPMLDRLDAIVERRTGQRRGVADGLDMDALQSTSDAGVSAAVSAAQAQSEMYARVFAEMTLKPLFRGMYQLLIEHQPEKFLARVAGEFVELDPRSWDPAMDLEVNVALGTTMTVQRLAALQAIIGEQKEYLQALGPSNPLVGLGHLSQTLIQAAELAGFRDAAGKFFNKIPLTWQPPAAEPEKSPEQVIAEAQIQIEQMKAIKDLEIQQAKLKMEKEEQDRQFERELQKDAAELALKQKELELKYQVAHLEAELAREQARNAASLEGHKALVDATLQTDQHEHEKEMATREQDHAQSLERDRHDHEKSMSERQTAAAEQAAARKGETE